MRCDELMKCHVTTLAHDASVAEAARVMKEAGCGILPVCDSHGQVLGVLTDRDIVVRACSEGISLQETPAAEIMTRRLVTCAPSDSVQAAEDLMMQHHKSRIIVTDAGRIAGVISLSDIAQCEEPLRLSRVVREISSREFRVEHA